MIFRRIQMEIENMSFSKAILLLLPIGVYIGLYVFVSSLLDLKEMWLGFLILYYWGMEKYADTNLLIKTIVPGAVVGVGISYALMTLPVLLGTVGIVITAVLVAFVVICSLTGWLKSFVNGSTFLFMTVLSIPMVSHEANHLEYIKVILVITAYISLSSYLMSKLKKPKTI